MAPFTVFLQLLFKLLPREFIYSLGSLLAHGPELLKPYIQPLMLKICIVSTRLAQLIDKIGRLGKLWIKHKNSASTHAEMVHQLNEWHHSCPVLLPTLKVLLWV